MVIDRETMYMYISSMWTHSRPVARFLREGGHFDVSVDLNATIIHVV